jgi:hypothetical protein
VLVDVGLPRRREQRREGRVEIAAGGGGAGAVPQDVEIVEHGAERSAAGVGGGRLRDLLKVRPPPPFPGAVTTFAQVLESALREPAPAPCRAPAFPAPPSFEAFQAALDRLPLEHRGGRRPGWAVELDLTLPCDAQAARRAFRRRALQTHPDRPGGSHEAFLRSVRALDEALSAVR